jgi:hypothetical protein
MLHTSKTQRFLDRLIQDTGSGRIKWRSLQPPKTPRTGTEEYTGSVYVATIKGQRFRLSPLRYRYYTYEDTFEWLDTAALELVDDQDAILWRFPGTPRITELLDEVQYASSGIERIIDEVLADT